MDQIISILRVEDDVYGKVNLIELIHKVDKEEPKATYYDTAGDQTMKRRIESFKVRII